MYDIYAWNIDCGDGSFYTEIFTDWQTTFEEVTEWVDDSTVIIDKETVDRCDMIYAEDSGRGFHLQRLKKISCKRLEDFYNKQKTA